ncbi:hypothetical protein WJX74_004148 [Apatococcus lobatus]|uniref:Rab3 GTPase-activating protein catalytic subunit n=1 Tax=Apatococcus lobatus TaxID=904363 RepID=A0AAW1Q566_9CHLO
MEQDFQDFTTATSWERLVSDLEQAVRSWQATGIERLRSTASNHSAQQLVKIRADIQNKPSTSLSLTLHLQPPSSDSQTAHASPGAGHALHALQGWFGIDDFLTLVPANYSQHFLNDEEASSMRSALATAMAAANAPWPAFIPVHEPSRDAWQGITACNGVTCLLETDSVRLSRLPVRLCQVSGQLQAFAEQLQPYAPDAARACRTTLAAGTASEPSNLVSTEGKWRTLEGPLSQPHAPIHHAAPPVREPGSSTMAAVRQGSTEIAVSCKRLLPLRSLRSLSGHRGSWWANRLRPDQPAWLSSLDEWDSICAWHPWAVQVDPIGSMELELGWEAMPAASGAAAFSEFATASQWHLHTLQPPPAAQTFQAFMLGIQPEKSGKRFLDLLPEEDGESESEGMGGEGERPSSAGRSGLDSSFGGMLQGLMYARAAAEDVRSLEQLASEEWWERRGIAPPAPPENTLQKVMTDLLGSNSLHQADEPDFQDLTAQEPFPPPQTLPMNEDSFSQHETALAPIAEPVERGSEDRESQHLSPQSLTQQEELSHQQQQTERELAINHPGSGLSSHIQQQAAAQATSTLENSLDRCMHQQQSQSQSHRDPDVGTASAASGRVSGSAEIEAQQASEPLLRRSDSMPGTAEAQQSSKPMHANQDAMMGPTTQGHLQERQQHAAGQIAAGLVSEEQHGAPRRVAPVNQDTGLPNTAPLNSLLSRFCLHAMLFGNARAVSTLWNLFIQHLRFSHWESLQPLPRMPRQPSQHPPSKPASPQPTALQAHPETPTSTGLDSTTEQPFQEAAEQIAGKLQQQSGAQAGSRFDAAQGEPAAPDLRQGLLHQKLQMLDVCIHRQQRRAAAAQAHAHESGMQLPSSTERNEQGLPVSEGGLMHSWEHGEWSPEKGPSPQYDSDAAEGPVYLSADEGPSEPTSPLPTGNPADPDSVQSFQQQPHAQSMVQGMSGSAALPWQGQSLPRASMLGTPEGTCGTLANQCLLHYPSVPIRVPATQEVLVMTQDMVEDRQNALAALGDSEAGQRARMRLQGDVLASDMAAFKAANPGGCLADFVRWHSPKDWLCESPTGIPGRLSPRMAAEGGGGVWHALWEGTEACPTARQKLLMDPEVEGEKVLHFLETLPPRALFDQLPAVAMATSLELLAETCGARLPQAAHLLARFSSDAHRLLDDSSVTVLLPRDNTAQNSEQQAPAESASRQGGAVLQLLGDFRHLESVIVAAESLHLRLPGQPGLANRVLQHALHLLPNPLWSSNKPSSMQDLSAQVGSHLQPPAASRQSQRISSHLRDADGVQRLQDAHSEHPSGSHNANADESLSARNQQKTARSPHDDLPRDSHSLQQPQQASGGYSLQEDKRRGEDTAAHSRQPSNPDNTRSLSTPHDAQPQLQSPNLPALVSDQAGIAAAMTAVQTEVADHPGSQGHWTLQSGVQIGSQEERAAILAVLEGQSGNVDEAVASEAGPSRQPAPETLVGEAEWMLTCNEPGRGRSGLQHHFHVKASTGSMRLAQTICCCD